MSELTQILQRVSVLEADNKTTKEAVSEVKTELRSLSHAVWIGTGTLVGLNLILKFL